MFWLLTSLNDQKEAKAPKSNSTPRIYLTIELMRVVFPIPVAPIDRIVFAALTEYPAFRLGLLDVRAVRLDNFLFSGSWYKRMLFEFSSIKLERALCFSAKRRFTGGTVDNKVWSTFEIDSVGRRKSSSRWWSDVFGVSTTNFLFKLRGASSLSFIPEDMIGNWRLFTRCFSDSILSRQ